MMARNKIDLAMRDWEAVTDYYGQVKAGYDLLAQSYDDDIGSNVIGSRMRRVLRETLLKSFRPGHRVLEIGCGTGIDALWLTRLGLDVVATDISDQMLAEVARKAAREKLAGRVECRRLAAKDIADLAETYGEQSFDGGYCHAGALNMEPDLPAVPRGLYRLLRPGCKFVCSVINITSLFEVLFYSAILRPRKAFRRMGNTIPIPISRSGPLSRYVVPARFYTPRAIKGLFRNDFLVEGVQGLQVFLPPSNLAPLYQTARPIFVPFDFLEASLSKAWPINTWGHHTIFTFRRL